MRGDNFLCDFRFILLTAAVFFIFIQVWLFTTQSEYADQLSAADYGSTQNKNGYLSWNPYDSLFHVGLVKEFSFPISADCIGKTGDTRSLSESLFDYHVMAGKGLQMLTDNELQVQVAAVVIMACNRADYLERTIKSVLKYHSSVASKYPLFVSQDGSNPDVRKKALSYEQLTYMQHKDGRLVQTERPGELIAYYKIANHYKWALDQLFYNHNFSRVIILEDDMEIAPDFFDYFEAASALMEKDRSIMAVSSWNDNGQKQFVHDPYVLYRSDFFPGLGWMLTRTTWDKLSPKWPKAYWDDWLRLQENHKGRQFLRPEVSRTYNFGEHGSSLGQFFKQYLETIKLNDVQVYWKSMDLSYLMEDKYPKYFAEILKKAKTISGANAALEASNIDRDVLIQYRDQNEFEFIARQFGIFEEWKDGVPRTAYKGVVVFRYQGPRRVFLVGPNSLQQLGITGT